MTRAICTKCNKPLKFVVHGDDVYVEPCEQCIATEAYLAEDKPPIALIANPKGPGLR
jgi:hypothetical protein